jgi:hypothetical protein
MATDAIHPARHGHVVARSIWERIAIVGEYAIGLVFSVIDFLIQIILAILRPMIPFLAPLLLVPVVLFFFALVILAAGLVVTALHLP